MSTVTSATDPSKLSTVRTMLFVPGDRPDRFMSALASGADAVIIDLEDAVEPKAKNSARGHAVSFLRHLVHNKPVVVRINQPVSRWGEDDLAALTGIPNLSGVMVPKSESSEELSRVYDRIAVPLIPLVETSAGVLASSDLALTSGVVRLAFGHLDFAAELGIDPANHVLLAPTRLSLAIASAANNLPGPIDGVSTEVRDLEIVAAETKAAMAAGCTSRLCVHPSQVEVIHATLAPSEDEVAWARRVLAVSVEDGIALVNGQMVDRPVLVRARSIIARSAPMERGSHDLR